MTKKKGSFPPPQTPPPAGAKNGIYPPRPNSFAAGMASATSSEVSSPKRARSQSPSPSPPMSDPGQPLVVPRPDPDVLGKYRRVKTDNADRKHSIHVPAVVPFEMSAVDVYVSECRRLDMKADPGVMAILASGSESLKFSHGYPVPGCLLPLRDLLSRFECVDLSQDRWTCRSGDGNANMLVLRNVLADPECKMRKIDLSYNGLDLDGITTLGAGLVRNGTVVDLVLKGNPLGHRGGSRFHDMMQARGVKYRLLDASFCSLGTDTAGDFLTLHENDLTGQPLDSRLTGESKSDGVSVNGNFDAEEMWNALSHGLGVILSILGTILLCVQVSGSPVHHIWGVVLFCIGLLAVFTSSTLLHSFYSIEGVLLVFQSMDHCAIFILIAGTYSPFCMLYASDDMIHLMKVQWGICLLGVSLYFGSLYGTWGQSRMYQYVELGLYVIMGNYLFLYWDQFMANMDLPTYYCLTTGGAVYMVLTVRLFEMGVPFFIWGEFKPIGHAIWHVFVLVAAIMHWFAVKYAVQHSLDGNGAGTVDPSVLPQHT